MSIDYSAYLVVGFDVKAQELMSPRKPVGQLVCTNLKCGKTQPLETEFFFCPTCGQPLREQKEPEEAPSRAAVALAHHLKCPVEQIQETLSMDSHEHEVGLLGLWPNDPDFSSEDKVVEGGILGLLIGALTEYDEDGAEHTLADIEKHFDKMRKLVEQMGFPKRPVKLLLYRYCSI